MSWKPLNFDSVLEAEDTVLVWDKAHKCFYQGIIYEVFYRGSYDSDPGQAVFRDEVKRDTIGGDCVIIVDSERNCYSYNVGFGKTKPDILYISPVNGRLVWPTNHWPVLSEDEATQPFHKNYSATWVVGVWTPGTNYGDAYMENVRRDELETD